MLYGARFCVSVVPILEYYAKIETQRDYAICAL